MLLFFSSMTSLDSFVSLPSLNFSTHDFGACGQINGLNTLFLVVSSELAFSSGFWTSSSLFNSFRPVFSSHYCFFMIKCSKNWVPAHSYPGFLEGSEVFLTNPRDLKTLMIS